MEANQTTTSKDSGELREVVAVFDSSEALQSAIDDLLTNGFHHSEISLLANEETVREKLGPEHIRASELEDSDVVPRSEYVDPESMNEAKAGIVGGLFYVGAIVGASAVMAAGGALASAIAAGVIAGGGGGLFGVALAKLIGDNQAKQVQEQLENGGLLLWARAWNKDKERTAISILERNGGRDVHAHVAAVA